MQYDNRIVDGRMVLYHIHYRVNMVHIHDRLLQKQCTNIIDKRVYDLCHAIRCNIAIMFIYIPMMDAIRW